MRRFVLILIVLLSVVQIRVICSSDFETLAHATPPAQTEIGIPDFLHTDAFTQPSVNFNFQAERTSLLSIFFFFLLVLVLSLAPQQKEYELSQPPSHLSHKLAYILYPFHSFW